MPVPISGGRTNQKRKKRRLLWIIAAALALYLMLDICGKCRFVTQNYTIEDARISEEFRIVLVSDLHSSLYGEGQSDLLAAIDAAAPDVVVLDGDIFHQHGKNKNALALLNALGGRWPCYFVPGNHEYQTNDIEVVRSEVEAAGIPILAGESVVLTKGETHVQLFGIDDGHGGKARQLRQLADAGAQRDDAVYSILAIHVPNSVEDILPCGFDLMLSGHTHGGQIRIPGLLNGLYAPGQGFFPEYGGGRYDFGEQTLIISRGLSQRPYWLPRVFDPPELVVVTLKPIEN